MITFTLLLSGFAHYRAVVFAYQHYCARGLLLSSIVAVCASFFFCTERIYAQAVYIEDALRYSLINGMLTPRAGALGLSFAGLADDYAALYVNPAGLTLLPLTEFSASGQINSYSSSVTHFGSTAPAYRTSPHMSHIGIAFPIRVGESGNYTIALGYAREIDFAGGDSIAGFNTVSSLIGAWVDNQRTGNLDGNPAWELALADVVNNRFVTPLRNNLQQNVSIDESGALSTLSIGIGVDITRNLSLGLSIVGIFGEYSYRRVFQETDIQNRYVRLDTRNLTDIDFSQMRAIELVDHSISGSRLVAGAQMRFGENVRAGLSASLPLGMQIIERVSTSYSALFDNGDRRFYNPNDPQPLALNLTLPWTLGAGAAAHLSGLVVTAGAELSDAPSIRASGRSIDVNAVQRAATQLLRMQFRAGVGAEYEFPNKPFVVRGSVAYHSSPYLQQSVSAGAISTIGLGGGYYVAPNARLDIAYRLSFRSYTTLLYSGAAYHSEQRLQQVAIQYVVRF
ncbi:MAG: hypothetical protein NZ661_08460 [Candidatus Kapabacteria bacterium]|nr:hypothetical protein [Candidatus Kapabacteria bacterium]